MKQAWPSVSLMAEDGHPKTHEHGLDAPGKRRPDVTPDTPDKPAPEIENTDPNAAENQPEPGQEPVPTPHPA